MGQSAINQQDQNAPNPSSGHLQPSFTLNYSNAFQNSFPKKKPIDKFIDDLAEGKEIFIKKEPRSIDMQLALKQEYETRHLPNFDHQQGNCQIS